MSFFASCATSEPSTNSTKEWISDCGWMTTSIRSPGRPKRKCASMTSRPLFIIVAESIVIFGPIFQVGCASASSTVIASKRLEAPLAERAARGRQHEAPRLLGPAAAHRLVDRAVLGVDRDDLGAAPRGLREDELARRRRAAPCWRARAACRRGPRRSAERRPSAPTSPPTTVSASGWQAASSRPSAPADDPAARRPAGSSRSQARHVLGAVDRDELRAEARDLLGELLDRAAGRERHDAEAIREGRRRRRATSGRSSRSSRGWRGISWRTGLSWSGRRRPGAQPD